ncbi:MAG: PP0621 family protein [Rhizobacter sp.]
MKYLLVLLVVLVVVWLARSSRRDANRMRGPSAPAQPTHQTMIACAQCGLHLPRDEALPGRGGVFCCEAHRTDYERAHPG